MKSVTREQARRLIGQPDPTCPTGLRNRLVLRLMYEAGLRGAEIAELRRGDVELIEGTVTAGQGKVRRVVPLLSAALEDLRKWLHRHPGGEWLTCTLQGGRISEDYLRQMVSREAEAAGLDPAEVSPRVLRDTCGVELAGLGFTIEEIGAVMGFADRRGAAKFTRVAAPGIAERLRARELQPPLPEKPDPAEILGELLKDAASRRALVKALVRELRAEVVEELKLDGQTMNGGPT